MRVFALEVFPPIKIGACIALILMFPWSNTEILHPYMGNLNSIIAAFLKGAFRRN
jgi:hypothetical protein